MLRYKVLIKKKKVEQGKEIESVGRQKFAIFIKIEKNC